MAPRRKSSSMQEEFPVDVVENIVDVDVSAEMETSFLEYSYSVIYSRALPDARDGLKPVQRRILYMMTQMGLRPDKGHVKSARVVGEVMGKLHPHGDAAIYDAMVRLAQPFAMRLPLVDGHGNFGSVDDGPAAARYTEARMAPAALAMTGDLDEDVVDFVPNYDNQFTQPGVLPSAFPNLLVNGSSGIAVGMATNMAPHNLREVIAGAQHLITHPQATLEDVMAFIPGPDLPTGGTIVGLSGIRDAYASGRGSFKTRAKVSIEQVTARKQGLVITELPYMVGPEKVIEKIKDGVQAKKLSGISDVVDLTDRKHGTRLVVELKNGFNPHAVLLSLYKHTPLEDSFGINNVALVDGQPQTLGLLELLRVYVDHRIDVVRRRTEHRLGRSKDRLHLVEGLLLAIVDIDEVIQIIRAAEETAEARTRLMQVFDLTQVQAEHILELRLRQLTKFSRIELEREQEELRARIAELEEILGSDAKLRSVVSAELGEVAERYGTDRRTVLTETDDLAQLAKAATPAGAKKTGKGLGLALETADDPCWVALSTSGLLGRTPGAPGGREQLADPGQRIKHDALVSCIPATARGEVGAVTSAGRMLRVSVMDLPVLQLSGQAPNLGTGVPVSEFLTLARGERVVGLVPTSEVIALGTRDGVVKRVNPDYPLNRDDWEVITLKGRDEVLGCAAAADDDHLVFITRAAKLLTFDASKVRPQGRTGSGVAGIKLAEDDAVLAFGVVRPGQRAEVVTIAAEEDSLPGTGAGSAKVTAFEEFPAKGRATGGVRAHRFLRGESRLALAFAGSGPVRAVSKSGVARSLPTEHGARDGSGVPLERGIDAVGPSLDGLDAGQRQTPTS
ncbi:DNA gyrase/topoisomerase IV subunit A [Rothia kristinae]|uniref:DNA gyrase/topoisomerase IV subunit A n=1 Tax=Rothia kristinae TaxID=37923 RepID=UPI00244CC98D|nr:DNA topoisomerase IV subunit A [Rothia kristinae]MDN5640042.1 DNA topoisomerase IV subunit A [Actinomycetes bacterium]WGH08642.1 DNA topoisomerase IV subunit A [Rothia kristinae]